MRQDLFKDEASARSASNLIDTWLIPRLCRCQRRRSRLLRGLYLRSSGLEEKNTKRTRSWLVLNKRAIFAACVLPFLGSFTFDNFLLKIRCWSFRVSKKFKVPKIFHLWLTNFFNKKVCFNWILLFRSLTVFYPFAVLNLGLSHTIRNSKSDDLKIRHQRLGWNFFGRYHHREFRDITFPWL